MEGRQQAAPIVEASLTRRYLLGELSASELAQVDERLFSDDGFFDDVLRAEEELMENYLESRLSDAERDRFERHFLASPSRRRNLEVARALLRRGAGPTTPSAAAAASDVPTPATPERARRRVRRWVAAGGLAAAAALVLVVGQGARERAAEPVAGDALPGGTVSLALGSGLVRGAQVVPEIVLPAGTRVLRLQLDPPAGDATGYRAVLRTADRALVWDGRDLRREQAGASAPIVVRVPAVLLEAADYVVTLRAPGAGGADEDVADYFFRVSAVGDRRGTR